MCVCVWGDRVVIVAQLFVSCFFFFVLQRDGEEKEHNVSHFLTLLYFCLSLSLSTDR